ncbi:MAG: DUF3576 domain-containing protein [Alphaproteobacteria bacterium]|nr:DUF3576 domain-containing protein [Alphaproteobacteria bacterium]
MTPSLFRTPRSISKFCLACAVVLLAGCAVGVDKEQDFPEFESRDAYRERIEGLEGGKEKVFGDLSLGGEDKKRGAAGDSFSTVNYYLWRATLETLDLGPLESADPFGGVIITDWFSLEEEPGSQYRVTAYILGRELRTDNIKVALYVKNRSQGQTSARRGSKTAETKLENAILAKARDIRANQFR